MEMLYSVNYIPALVYKYIPQYENWLILQYPDGYLEVMKAKEAAKEKEKEKKALEEDDEEEDSKPKKGKGKKRPREGG